MGLCRIQFGDCLYRSKSIDIKQRHRFHPFSCSIIENGTEKGDSVEFNEGIDIYSYIDQNRS